MHADVRQKSWNFLNARCLCHVTFIWPPELFLLEEPLHFLKALQQAVS